MQEELKNSLFVHQNIDSPLYYLSGTIVLAIAIIGLICLFIYYIIKSVKTHKNIDYTRDLTALNKTNLLSYTLIGLSSFLVFVISYQFFPHPILEGWGEKIGVLLFFPFIAAVTIGGLGKVTAFTDNKFLHSIRFGKVYFFTLVFLVLRFILLNF